MATAVQKAISSPAGQAAVRGRAAAIARKKVEEATKAMRERFKKAAPALRKDVIESFAVPAATGAAGALALDMTLGRLPYVSGAKGDIMKGTVAVLVGTVGKKYIKSPYLHSAAVGAATVNLYKLATRALNRAGDKKLSSLLAGDDDSDLSSASNRAGGNLIDVAAEPVLVSLTDGRTVRAYPTSSGDFILANLPDEQQAAMTIGYVPGTLNGDAPQQLVI